MYKNISSIKVSFFVKEKNLSNVENFARKEKKNINMKVKTLKKTLLFNTFIFNSKNNYSKNKVY